MSDFTLLFSKEQFKKVFTYFLQFAKSPIETVKNVPLWDWAIVLATLGLFSAISGLAIGILQKKFLAVFLGLTFVPIGSIIVTFIISGFFYYTFLFLFHRQVTLQKIFCIVFVCSTPNYVGQILVPVAAPFALIGLMASAFLLVVGLTENFQLPRKTISKLVACLFAIYVVAWISQQISFSKDQKVFWESSAPQNLDDLEREVLDQ